MQEAVAMPLRAVREMPAEFFHAPDTMILQSPAVHQTTLIQQEEPLRVQQTTIAQLVSWAQPHTGYRGAPVKVGSPS